MLLSPKLAGKIINEVQTVMDEDIIVVDANGIIIASTQKNRIGNFHRGAQIVLQTQGKLYIDEVMEKRLEGVRMGINMPIQFEGRIIGVIGVTGSPKEVEHFAELIRRLTELIIQETVRTEQTQSKTRGLEAYFYEWATLQAYDQHFAERGMMLGIPVQSPHICCFLQLGAAQATETEMYERLKYHFETGQDMIVRWGPGLYLLLKDVGAPFSEQRLNKRFVVFQQAFLKKYGQACAIGVGKTAGTFVIHQSFIEAKKALKAAEKSGGIVFYQDLLLDLLVEEVSEDSRKAYLEKTAEKLRGHAGLLETLQAYLANNLSLKETALELHVHINTLHYRLKQITEVTGIDPKTTEGIALFYLAVQLAE
ncbi:CdaR family transcriptional regulator [Heyndrickxia acidiproducens]|uniref:CdaR family transcriptional regulator n=1 Tax=Heyndrickxia acidiproducens TaxID=1121084 RepID=UPI0003758630|nr:sugar diacid recognition domain-containing protein [Heyndrickxia acidiproducens]